MSLTSLISTILAQLTHVMTDKTISVTTLPLFITEAMQLAEGVSGLTGAQKSTLVISVISDLISSSPLDDAAKEALLLLLNTIAPALINALVLAAKGVYNFGKKVEEEIKTECCSLM